MKGRQAADIATMLYDNIIQIFGSDRIFFIVRTPQKCQQIKHRKNNKATIRIEY